MATKTKAELREWAKARCESWNWNATVAEIAKELIDADIDTDSAKFEVLGEEFVKFFGRHDPNAQRLWGIVGQIIETFS